jgi:hypothetical protein
MKINLFFCGRKVKTIKRKEPVSNWNEVIKKNYKVTIIGHKDIFRKFIVTIYLQPTKLLADPTDKEVNLNCELYGGADIE